MRSMYQSDLYLLIRELSERQQYYAGLMARALTFHQPDDPFMLAMYEVQDRMYAELRSLLENLPGVDPVLLEYFDSLQQEYRLNMMLVSSRINPLTLRPGI